MGKRTLREQRHSHRGKRCHFRDLNGAQETPGRDGTRGAHGPPPAGGGSGHADVAAGSPVLRGTRPLLASCCIPAGTDPRSTCAPVCRPHPLTPTRAAFTRTRRPHGPCPRFPGSERGDQSHVLPGGDPSAAPDGRVPAGPRSTPACPLAAGGAPARLCCARSSHTPGCTPSSKQL